MLNSRSLLSWYMETITHELRRRGDTQPKCHRNNMPFKFVLEEEEDDDNNNEEEADAALAVLVEQGKEVSVEAGGATSSI